MDTTDNALGERIRELRARIGIDVKQLAAACGTSLSAIYQIERGERKPGFDLACLLADALRVKLDALRKPAKKA